ncbi:MAG TPA: VOC family protein [Devosia sp.]|nr:VOC family protein [Devosia sp.]
MISLPNRGGLGPLAQIGFVVRDIDAAMEEWMRVADIRSFLCFDQVVNPNTVHRGQRTNVDISIAIGYASDDLEIEIISQRNDGPSPYSEFIGSGREGLQHLAYLVDDCPPAWQKLEEQGLERVYSVIPENDGFPITYFDGPNGFGAMVEIVPGSFRPMREARRKFLNAETTAPGVHRFATMGAFYKQVGLI